jgi:AraC-like DNA-binding protein
MITKARIANYLLDWLMAPDAAGLRAVDEGPDATHLPYALPPEVGEAWAESLALRDGIVLFRAVHLLAPSPPGQLVSLMEANIAPAERVFNAQVWLSGLACHREYWRGRDQAPVDIIATPGHDTFRLHQKWQAQVLVEGGSTSEMRSVILPAALLRSLLGEGAAQHLLDSLGLRDARPTVVRPMPSHVSAPLREAMSGQFSGAARKLYAQARVLDYLAGLHRFVTQEHMVLKKEPTHLKQVQELHRYLLLLEGRVPSLSALAIDFGLSARRLNEEFAAEYGASIFSFVTSHRLEQAHASLLAGNTPMKVLSARLGYSHVNHFISAFKRKFGYSPGSLRRK